MSMVGDYYELMGPRARIDTPISSEAVPEFPILPMLVRQRRLAIVMMPHGLNRI